MLAAPSPSLANVFVYFGQSNLAGQIIVFLLVIFSLLAWTVMIGKFMDLRRLRDLNHSFSRRLTKTDEILRVDLEQMKRSRGPYVALTHDALEAYYRSSGTGASEAGKIGHVENALQRGVAESTIQYESKMVLLGSIVTGAPFMGLLGTVWGVMDAFGSIATTGGGSIQSLAPGVSGALLTTVAGLLVAIPSVFGYNYLLTQVKIMITEVENFASSLADRVELEDREKELS